jgi:bifunctional non-homologous end joining protein LigD
MGLELYRKKRDFGSTPEPSGARRKRTASRPRFVVQKHAASQLHYDFRLELGGVLLSWAVPKGPSLDPQDKRLAIHVEDHPLEYGDFEGRIPPRQYGAGTVMLWDRGTWSSTSDPAKSYRAGELKFKLHGKKLHGGWALVKTSSGKFGRSKAWLLIKERDRYARSDAAIVDEAPDSVASGRAMEQIARADEPVWQLKGKKRAKRSAAREAAGVGSGTRRARSLDSVGKLPQAIAGLMPRFIQPELATLVKAIPPGDDWLHEMKYDGYRMLCKLDRGKVELYTRNRNLWTAKLPELAAMLGSLPARSAWIDGEIVMVEPDGRSNFQALQNAIGGGASGKVRYYAFDLMYLDGYDLRNMALGERKRLLRALVKSPSSHIHYSEHVVGMGEDFLGNACRLKLEGVISKRMASVYAGRRTLDWVKTKCGLRQEMVVGGFTLPAGSRTGLGALMLGAYANGKLSMQARSAPASVPRCCGPCGASSIG